MKTMKTEQGIMQTRAGQLLLTIDHGIGSQVRIKAIDMVGQVSSVIFDEMGIQYRIVYWNDGCRQSDWMFVWELEACNE